MTIETIEDGPVREIDVNHLPKAGLTVEVPFNSEPYQAYLRANARIEHEREELGAPTADAYEALRVAVAGVTEFAKTWLGGN